MTKWRFAYLFCSLIISVALLIVILFFYDDYLFDLYFGILLINLIIIFWFRRLERKKLFEMTMIYLNELDPLRYLEAYEKYNRQRLRSKNAKLMDEITKAQILLDAGKIPETREVLESLIDREPQFSAFVRFWYYKNWINYFDEVDDPARMKFLLNQLSESIETLPQKYRWQMLANLHIIEARYYVHEGIFLDTAEERYSEILKGNSPRLMMMHCVYQMGVIAYKTGRFDIAKSRLQSVVKNGNQLHIVTKAEELLNKMASASDITPQNVIFP
jgi:tetratricopeptide (TPR) repeat protein